MMTKIIATKLFGMDLFSMICMDIWGIWTDLHIHCGGLELLIDCNLKGLTSFSQATRSPSSHSTGSTRNTSTTSTTRKTEGTSPPNSESRCFRGTTGWERMPTGLGGASGNRNGWSTTRTRSIRLRRRWLMGSMSRRRIKYGERVGIGIGIGAVDMALGSFVVVPSRLQQNEYLSTSQ